MTVCSYKTVVKFFPHQAADLELAVGLLEQCEEEVRYTFDVLRKPFNMVVFKGSAKYILSLHHIHISFGGTYIRINISDQIFLNM